MKTIQQLLDDLQCGEEPRTVKQIDSALESFNISEILASLSGKDQNAPEAAAEKTAPTTDIDLNKEDFDLFRALQEALEVIIKEDETKSLELNAKVRRKVKRLHELIAGVTQFNQPKYPVVAKPTTKPKAAPKSTENDDDDAMEEEVDNSHLLQDKDLVELIEKVKESKTAADLENNIAVIKDPNLGNTHSRRKLKRTIEQLVDKVESEMNAKIRRRVNRVIKMLSPGEAHQLHISGAGGSNNADGQKKNKKDGEHDEDGNPKKKAKKESNNPFVVFIGQLPYSCKEADLVTFFRDTHAIGGDIKVRLLTNSSTKEFKGMAFAEFTNYENMKKALLLHHAVFQGRKINIERSNQIGKKNTQRDEICQQNKERQSKEIHHHFNELFQNFEEKGVLVASTLGREFKEKLMRYSPIYLEKAMNEYAQLDKKERTLRKLDELFMIQVSSPTEK